MSRWGGVTAEEAAVHLKTALGGCPHSQAEPVILSTGETVACVCIACWDPLPAAWVRDQMELAHRVAYCRHENEVTLCSLGDPVDTLLCVGCGRQRTA
jgi:hypothetical protein